MEDLPTRELFAQISAKAGELVRKEVELAKAEIRADLAAEARMASGLGIAAICALLALAMALTAGAFAMAESGALPGWAAALILTGILLLAGLAVGLWGWSKRVRKPLGITRKTLVEGMQWARHQIG
jgi:hypothetical protein